MGHMTRLFIILIFAVVITPVWSQDWVGGLDITGAFPQGELKDNLVDEGAGVGLYAMRQFKNSPWYMGLDAVFVNYGDRKFDGPIDLCCSYVADDLTVKNNVNHFQLALRWQPAQLPLRPYLEGLAGIKQFTTTTRLGDDFDDGFDAVDRETDDTTWSAGIGGGLLYSLRRPIGGPGIALEFGARYLLGGEADYVREETVTFDGVQVGFQRDRSKTDLLTVKLGLQFRF